MGAFALAGCSAPESATEERANSERSAAETVRARAARDSEELGARYDAVIAAHPGLADRLAPLRADVTRHVSAFAGPASPKSARSPSPTAGSGSPSASGSPVPSDGKAALLALAEQERRLADRRTKALPKVPGELARLLASVAAAGAAHVYLLSESAKAVEGDT
ncbi:hypothetical protein [Streptomyces cavernae]|uniref:hypothetical protein n=1 Tax=Streptomyces cavernae TaxID=2259034 RepID=UPI001EE3F08E|nr:hypothetical protein [Streptomyces cavernae]